MYFQAIYFFRVFNQIQLANMAKIVCVALIFLPWTRAYGTDMSVSLHISDKKLTHIRWIAEFDQHGSEIHAIFAWLWMRLKMGIIGRVVDLWGHLSGVGQLWGKLYANFSRNMKFGTNLQHQIRNQSRKLISEIFTNVELVTPTGL